MQRVVHPLIARRAGTGYGRVDVSLLLGGLRHREQQYNLQGANAYLNTIPAASPGRFLKCVASAAMSPFPS